MRPHQYAQTQRGFPRKNSVSSQFRSQVAFITPRTSFGIRSLFCPEIGCKFSGVTPASLSHLRSRFHRHDPKIQRGRLTGDHRAARVGKAQKVWQADDRDELLVLIVGTLCARSFFTLNGEVFKSEEGNAVSDSSRCNDSEGTAAAYAVWYMRRERLKTSLLAQLQELVKRARQLMNMGVDCRYDSNDSVYPSLY